MVSKARYYKSRYPNIQKDIRGKAFLVCYDVRLARVYRIETA